MSEAPVGLVVHGHREGNACGGQPWISEECLARVRAAERAAARYAVTHVLFSGAGAKGFPSEARQMAEAWRQPRLVSSLDEASLDSAENAHAAVNWAAEIGAKTLVVVSSWWHLRLWLYYAPARCRGLAVQHVLSFRWKRFPSHLLHEVRYLPEALRGTILRRRRIQARETQDRMAA